MFIRRLPAFEYHTPATVSEALGLMGRYGEAARLIAGGTDLLIAMKKREAVPGHLISLSGVEGLQGMSFDDKEGLRIGSLTTLAEIEASDIVKEIYTPLWDAVRVMASVQVRSLATIGSATTDQCETFARRRVDPERLVIVIVGDASVVAKDLEAMAPVTVVDREGKKAE